MDAVDGAPSFPSLKPDCFGQVYVSYDLKPRHIELLRLRTQGFCWTSSKFKTVPDEKTEWFLLIRACDEDFLVLRLSSCDYAAGKIRVYYHLKITADDFSACRTSEIALHVENGEKLVLLTEDEVRRFFMPETCVKNFKIECKVYVINDCTWMSIYMLGLSRPTPSGRIPLAERGVKTMALQIPAPVQSDDCDESICIQHTLTVSILDIKTEWMLKIWPNHRSTCKNGRPFISLCFKGGFIGSLPIDITYVAYHLFVTGSWYATFRLPKMLLCVEEDKHTPVKVGKNVTVCTIEQAKNAALKVPSKHRQHPLFVSLSLDIIAVGFEAAKNTSDPSLFPENRGKAEFSDHCQSKSKATTTPSVNAFVKSGKKQKKRQISLNDLLDIKSTTSGTETASHASEKSERAIDLLDIDGKHTSYAASNTLTQHAAAGQTDDTKQPKSSQEFQDFLKFPLGETGENASTSSRAPDIVSSINTKSTSENVSKEECKTPVNSLLRLDPSFVANFEARLVSPSSRSLIATACDSPTKFQRPDSECHTEKDKSTDTTKLKKSADSVDMSAQHDIQVSTSSGTSSEKESCAGAEASSPGNDDAKLSGGADLNRNILCKLLSDHRFADVTFVVQNKELRAHKCILALRSDAFGAMFTSSKNEKESTFEICDTEYEVFKELLRYVYTDEIPELSNSMARKLFAAADTYHLWRLKNKCEDIACGQMTKELVIVDLTLAIAHSGEKLKSAAIEYIKQNKEEVVKTKAWKKFRDEHREVWAKLVEYLI